jgi:hypothetical protein
MAAPANVIKPRKNRRSVLVIVFLLPEFSPAFPGSQTAEFELNGMSWLPVRLSFKNGEPSCANVATYQSLHGQSWRRAHTEGNYQFAKFICAFS